MLEWQSSIFRSEYLLQCRVTSNCVLSFKIWSDSEILKQFVSSLAVCPPSQWRTSMDPARSTLHWPVNLKHTLYSGCFRFTKSQRYLSYFFCSNHTHVLFQGSQVSWWVLPLCLCVWPDPQNWCCTPHLSARATSNPCQASATAVERPPRSRLARVRKSSYWNST